MKISLLRSVSAVPLAILLPMLICCTAIGDTILDSGTISVMEANGGGFLGGTANFTIAAGDIPDIELLANFNIVDAGVDIVVNGVSLFPQFVDISQFGPEPVFGGTGFGGGGVSFPFSPNDNGLPRLTVESTVAGTNYSGAIETNSSAVSPYTPLFTTQDFSSLLISGANQIEFRVLNSFEGANLQGDFTVTQITQTSVPEPGTTSLALLALVALGVHRRR